MKIYDCFSYWDEDLLLNLRFNLLSDIVDYFVVVESTRTWQNNKKELIFDIVGDLDSPDIQPLIPDPRNAAIDYFRQTGIYPISHALVVKDQLLADNPWLGEELFSVFDAAKNQYLTRLASGASEGPQDEAMAQMQQIIGNDPLLYGLEPNRKSLESFIQFNVDQKIIPQSLKVDDIFA